MNLDEAQQLPRNRSAVFRHSMAEVAHEAVPASDSGMDRGRRHRGTLAATAGELAATALSLSFFAQICVGW